MAVLNWNLWFLHPPELGCGDEISIVIVGLAQKPLSSSYAFAEHTAAVKYNARTMSVCALSGPILFHVINVWLNNARVTDCLRSTVCFAVVVFFFREEKKVYEKKVHRKYLQSPKCEQASEQVRERESNRGLFNRNRRTDFFSSFLAHHAGMMSTTFDIVFISLSPYSTSRLLWSRRMEKSISRPLLSFSLLSHSRLRKYFMTKPVFFPCCLSIILIPGPAAGQL